VKEESRLYSGCGSYTRLQKDTSHKVTEKDIEDSGRMILYNVYNTY